MNCRIVEVTITTWINVASIISLQLIMVIVCFFKTIGLPKLDISEMIYIPRAMPKNLISCLNQKIYEEHCFV